MNVLQLPRCLFGSHHRDRRRAWYDGPVVRSHCTGCGKPMFKDIHGWHIDGSASSKNQATSE